MKLSDIEYVSADMWDTYPDEYLGDCLKQCGTRVMVKGDPDEFDSYGVYICTGCGYAYPPDCEPNIEKREGRNVYAIRWDDDGNEIDMPHWTWPERR